MRPIEDVGTIYRRFPSLWKVFLQDEATPGRYKLVAERQERPAGAYMKLPVPGPRMILLVGHLIQKTDPINEER